MRWVGSLALAAALVLHASAPFAVADFRSAFLEGGPDGAVFKTRGSNGYSIEVSASGDAAFLVARNRFGDAVYFVPAKLRGAVLTARFGSRGKIAVRFRQTEGFREKMPPRRCKGKPHLTRYGVFTGTIRFRGERGFTAVDRQAARGRFFSQPRWQCRRPGGKIKPLPPDDGVGEADFTTLEANAHNGNIFFEALAAGPSESTAVIFLAQLREQRERMEVSRTAFVFGHARRFQYDPGLGSAEVRPPAPFHGTASFSRGPGGRALWRGPLTVALPGAPRLSLAGSRFQAKLVNSPFPGPQAESRNGG